VSALYNFIQRFDTLSEYVRFRELFVFLVWRDIKIRYKQTVLGALWAIIQPFAMMVVFSLIFGKGAKVDSGGVPYAIFYYSILVPWTFFQVCVPMSGNSLISNSKLISKVYFPRAIIPSASALGGIVDFFIASGVLLAIMVYYKFPIEASLLLWPLFVMPLAILIIAVGMVFSSLNVKYRDIKYTIPFFIQVMLFISGVAVPISQFPEKYHMILGLNPVAAMLNAFRAAALPGVQINWTEYGIACAVSVALLILAATYFRKTEKAFADLI